MSAMRGVLTLNRDALRKNYTYIDSLSAASCQTAASIKANAYGLGMSYVAPVLADAGCSIFFVATVDEGIALRDTLPQAIIYVLNGFAESCAQDYAHYRLSPVLNALYDIHAYRAFARQCEDAPPAVLHFDTGMNRLGIVADEAVTLAAHPHYLEGITIDYVMSHFAAAEDVDDPFTAVQHKRFENLIAPYHGLKKSLCNSAGIFRDAAYHYDLTRSGIAIYGSQSVGGGEDGVTPVVSLCAPVLQVHTVKKGEQAGYNGTYCFERDGAVAVVSLGYADGFSRSLSNQGRLYWGDHGLPVRGRVSMDTVICDLSHLPERDYPTVGDRVEVLGAQQTIDDMARIAGMIPYEVLTSLGRRYDVVLTGSGL